MTIEDAAAEDGGAVAGDVALDGPRLQLPIGGSPPPASRHGRAVLLDVSAPGRDEAQVVVCLQQLDAACGERRLEHVVGVQRQHVAPARDADAEVARGAEAAVVRRSDVNGIARRELGQHDVLGLKAAVVDDDHLDARVRLGARGGDGVLDEAVHAVVGDHDADERHGPAATRGAPARRARALAELEITGADLVGV